ncbi:MAG: TolC family protein [Candidatus Omnitrophica bacterium]|nr:TolC family protein [Candidatus Omnitrophota bacterium]
MKRIIFLITFSVVALFTYNIAIADSPAEDSILQIGLDETIKRALDTSEELKIKDSEVRKSKGIYGEVRSEALPHISGQSTWTNNMDYPDKAAGKYYDHSLDSGLNASQLVWSFGKVMYAIDSAKNAVEATRWNSEASRQDVIFAAKLSYYSCLLARNTLSIAEKSYADVLENKKLLGQRSYGGRSSKYEIVKINADVSARIPAVNEARTQFDAAIETLRRVIDVDFDRKIELEGNFQEQYADFNYETLVNAMYAYEPSLQGLAKSIDSAEANVKSKYANFLPTISAFASMNYRGDSNENSVLKRDELDSYSAAGLKVSIPIWEGGAKEAQLSQAKADKEIAVFRKRQVERNFLLELKKAYLEYAQYKDNLKANIEAVSLAEEAFMQTQEMFSSGQVSVTDLNIAELSLTNQRLNKEATLYNINITLAKIEKLVTEKYEHEKS